MTRSRPTRRHVLQTGAAALAAGLGVVGTATASNDRGKNFGRVWANDVLWRTNVVKPLDERPTQEDVIYFINDGVPGNSLPPSDTAVNGGASPFVSESAPGDQDWNGGQWVHKSARLPRGEALDEPLTSEADVLAAANAGTLEIEDRRPPDVTTPENDSFGPPRYFICPLNGRD